MKILVDADVVLDVILGREPWLADSAAVLSAVSEGRVEGFLAGHTITTVHYLVTAGKNRRAATAATVELLEMFDVVPVARSDFHRALTLDLPVPALPPGAMVAMLR